MSDKKVKIYEAEFKESSVKLALESEVSIAQTARDLGVPPHTMYTWVSKYSKGIGSAMKHDQHIYDEVKQLKKELARVTQERDLLKKAAAYFAKNSQ
jgi:transposase